MNKKLVIVTADDHSVITKYMSFILKEIFNDAEIFQFNTLKDIVKFLENSTLDLIILDWICKQKVQYKLSYIFVNII